MPAGQLQQLQGVCVPRLLARDIKAADCTYCQLVTELIPGGRTVEELMAGEGTECLMDLGRTAEAVSVVLRLMTL